MKSSPDPSLYTSSYLRRDYFLLQPYDSLYMFIHYMFKSISEEQAGFGRGYSTIDNAFILYNRQRLYRLQYTTPLSFTIDNAFIVYNRQRLYPLQ